MVVLAASICTRGGKAVLSRSFREMQRSRIEALLASFPKQVADSQHTTVEQDNVRYVYQPRHSLDELYMVLITNRQSNILQDIDSLHLFAQVVTSICRTLDEREILRNAFELLSAFDELVNMGYRENLTLSQIKTFLDMESHEERVAMIIESNKQQEAAEVRKAAARKLENQRREQNRMGRNQIPRTPSYPIYTPPVQQVATDAMDSYSAEKNRSRTSAASSKGMQLGKKSKTNSLFDQVRASLPDEFDAPLVTPAAATTTVSSTKPSARQSLTGDREAIHVTVNETISATLTREGTAESFEVKGDLQLRISDASMTAIKLSLETEEKTGVLYNTHPKVDKALFNRSKVIQLKDASKGFPANSPIGVMRWRYAVKNAEMNDLPLTVTAWVNAGSDDTYSVTVEYELTGGSTLRDAMITIPFASGEPSISSHDAIYEMSGDSLDWTIGNIDADNPSGSFEFEAQADSDSAFFPMSIHFSKSQPFIDVNVSSVALVSMNQDVPFSKDVRSVAESFVVA